jgi:hypothetical protein
VDGPKIIFDKSFLHRLKAEHLFELDIFFDIIPAPILKMEILADLSKHETSKTDWVSRSINRPPEDDPFHPLRLHRVPMTA